MAKRMTDEEIIHKFFTDGPEAKVEIMFNIVKGIMRGRTASSPNGSGAKTKAKSGPKPKTNQAATTSAPQDTSLPM